MPSKPKIAPKELYNYVKTSYYNFSHNKMANKALKTIEKEKGKANPKELKLAEAYAKDILGWKGYAPWLKAYTAMAGEFKEGWLPENYFGNVVVPKLQGEVGKTSFLKPLSKRLFESDAFSDIGYLVNGSFYDKNYKICSASEIKEKLFSKSGKIVFKLNNSFQGRGVFVLEQATFNTKQVVKFGAGVFQNYIEQHSFFNQIMPNSVATIRLLTVLDDFGESSLRAAYLRVGRNKDSHVKSSSQIVVPIALDSGNLNELGHSKMWFTMKEHPDTNFKFKGEQIPRFKEMVETVLTMQKKMSFVRCIGWDVVLDKDDKIQVMEWNGFHTGIGFAEFTQGPCFKNLGWEHLWKE
ncbi:sugar-transfer associated ATP-grasp domain-containing protein [Croceivirga sp. JEA036]|uniref:sugar-transfer associated ATP-grasp domain-containing protein n=1 Tax=Croceivirga sp. JEA036 TaxID=2721162 RepID=UPI001438FA28|nr:sugar-transfer associated ATP-grasp domain-containing protein [Croceivirga sp. JEA036]NJB38064.1 hypothetical protein [Croceivirga sp. JEA036]